MNVSTTVDLMKNNENTRTVDLMKKRKHEDVDLMKNNINTRTVDLMNREYKQSKTLGFV